MRPLRPAVPGACLALAAAATFGSGLLAVSRPAHADVDVRFDIGQAPPAPHVVFRSQPHRWYDPGTRVYVIDDPRLGDNDAFDYAGSYWLFRDGYWYRSRDWHGGFRVVDPRDVPTAIYRVPRERWHNPPTYASWHDRGPNRGPGRRGMERGSMDRSEQQRREMERRHSS